MTTSELINKLQELKTDDDYLFTKGISGIDISKTIKLDDILFRKSSRSRCFATPGELPFEICDRVESFNCYAYKKSYTTLGIILFELLFSDLSYVEICISNNQSEIKQLFVYVERSFLLPFLKIDQKETYKSFEYFSSKIDRYPLTNYFTTESLPTFHFSFSNDQDRYIKNSSEKADQLILSTSISGLVLTAELFLNIGRIDNKQDEICLENPLYGVGGVGETSIEARFWLPNSLGFYTEKIEDLKF